MATGAYSLTVSGATPKYNLSVVNGSTLNLTMHGPSGRAGRDAYQSYLDTTTDDPPLSEAEWSEGGGSAPVVSPTPPPNPTADMLWTDSTEGSLNQWDADQSVWVNLSHERPAVPLITAVAFCGDSITAMCSSYRYAPPQGLPAYGSRGYSSYAAAILEHAITSTVNEFSMNTTPDFDFGWDGIKANEYLSNTTLINTIPEPDKTYPEATPVSLAIASNPDAFVLLIGTNDLFAAADEAVPLANVTALATEMRATGNPVFLCSVLPRTTTGMQAKIDAFNSALPAVAASLGCVYVDVHSDLIANGTQITSYFYDDTHPNKAGASVIGSAIAEAMLPYVADPYAVPALDSARWLTPNPTLAGSAASLPTGWIENNFVSPVYTRVVDDDGVTWIKIEETSATYPDAERRIYPPFVTSGVATLISEETPVRGIMRYQIPAAADVKGLAIYAEPLTAGYVILRSAAYCDKIDAPDGPIVPHSGLMLTEKTAFPATATQGRFTISMYGKGPILVRQCGFITDP